MKRIITIILLLFFMQCLKNLNHPLDITKPTGLLLNCILFPNVYDFCNLNNNSNNKEIEVLEPLRGVLDPTFGNNGIIYIDNPEITATLPFFSSLGNLIIDTNQNILLAGSRSEKLFIARLNVNGSFDTTFDVDGIWEYDIPTSTKETLTDITITLDNKILTTGASINTTYDNLVLRMNSDGTVLDFINPTTATIHEMATSIAIQTMGYNEYYLVGGYNSNNNIVIQRYKDSLGILLLDTTFNAPFGLVDLDINAGSYIYLSSLKTQADGNIIFCGNAINSGNTEMFLVRYQSNGTGYDTSFNGTGKVISSFGGNNSISDVKIQSDNKILIAGKKQDKLYIARYNENGILDTTFGVNGEVVEDISGSFSKMQLLSDGRIIAGGSIFGSDSQLIVVSYNQDGTRDTSFGDNGIFIYNYSNNISHNEYLQGLDIQIDGGKEKIIVGANITLSFSSPYDQDIYIIRIE